MRRTARKPRDRRSIISKTHFKYWRRNCLFGCYHALLPVVFDLIPLFDAHCDTILSCFTSGCSLRRNGGHIDLLRGGRYRPYAQFFAIWGEAGLMGEAREETLFWRELALFQRELENNSDLVRFCASGADADKAASEGRAAAFLSVEGAGLLGCDLRMLRSAYLAGVRAVNITWNHANILSGTNVEEPTRGLSGAGREFVREMQRLGMLVDVSHISEPGFWDVLETAARPVMASHSNAKALCGHTRNLSDEQFRALVQNGGVAGLNLCPDFLGGGATAGTCADHIEHFLSLGGAKHICIGGDLDGIERMPDGMTGIESVQKIYEELRRRGHGVALLEDIFYNNLARVVTEVCGIPARETNPCP